MTALRGKRAWSVLMPVPWLAAAVVAALLLAVASSRLFSADERLFDRLLRLRGERPPLSEVVLVAIDDDSISQLGLRWPWPRDVYADMLERVANAGAAVCAFDLLFTEQDSRDPVFADAIRNAGIPVILTSKLYQEQRQEYASNRHLRPVHILEEAATGFGYANLPIDADGVVRTIPVWDEFEGVKVRSFWLSVASAYSGRENIECPVGARINYLGGPGSVPTLSFYQVLGGLVPAESLRDKIVVVGTTSEDLGDQHLTPFASAGMMSGVEIQASIIDTMLAGVYMKDPPPIVEFLINISFGVILALAVSLVPAWVCPILCVVLVVGLLFVAVCMIEQSLVIDVFPTVLMGVLMPPAVYGYRYVRAERARRYLGEVFSRYVPHDIMASILVEGEEADTAKRVVSILFCDLREFTSLSARLSPEETVSFLNSFFQSTAGAVASHNGVIMKFLGDGFMAVFGLRRPDQNHAQDAVEAAIDIASCVRDLSVTGLDRDELVRVGLGVHTGEVAVASVGSLLQRDYTVVGEPVNVASRLEDVTRRLETCLAISAQTRDMLDSRTRELFREIPAVEIRGIPEPMTVYGFIEEGVEFCGQFERDDQETQDRISL